MSSSSAKKFGTFGGVFTPSILTILGVIMYLRLPWIVGQAGLWMTIGIIVIAHFISVTTGLSVASIATDKRVQAGGTYYMISRSLGLPIGGTLGVALFTGMSFSVSLYLIGFSESFIGYIGLEKTANNIRMVGSISLLVVATITIISTSLAMKMQYFIMAAILLSLGSILFGTSESFPPKPHLSPLSNNVGFAVLFSIFFPAVTGFEAGVSMSGDLKDPKKSIPIGTILAIVVGLLVYIGLAVFFAFRVDSGQLAENPDVLKTISLNVPILLAGIWGATVSSAIGSVLGAPRVLQATSQDRITPRIFAVGYGKTNEPRNALLLTVLIAESGILIGELDLIARIVSMFFIAAYGFLNLSAAIESWASPDFRPDFKIPRWVSLLGALVCLVIMIQLDILAMMGATSLMAILFIYLKKKELNLESGDTWEGMWSSIVRQGLYRLSKNPLHERNWRPNILLFSGGSDSRPYLVEFSKSLADKRGIITNFHLHEKDEETEMKRSTIVEDTGIDEFDGIFSRKIECSDVYEEMLNISRYHGFTGMEPNTILLGRARGLKNAMKFGGLIERLERMDFNVLMLDFNKTKGFGTKDRVDVWWSGHGKNMSLTLALVRFLQSSKEWSEANFRFLMITEDITQVDLLRRRVDAILSEYRIPGEVIIIHNGRKDPFISLLSKESQDASLNILGLPDYHLEDAMVIAKKIEDFSLEIGSILWVKSSSYFHDLKLFTTSQKNSISKSLLDSTHALIFPDNESIASLVQGLYSRVEKGITGFYGNQLHNILLSLEQLFESFAGDLDSEQEGGIQLSRQKTNAFLWMQAPENLNNLIDSFQLLLENLQLIGKDYAKNTVITRKLNDYQINLSDSPSIKFKKWKKRVLHKLSFKDNNALIDESVNLKIYIDYYLKNKLYNELFILVKALLSQTILFTQKVYQYQLLLHSQGSTKKDELLNLCQENTGQINTFLTEQKNQVSRSLYNTFTDFGNDLSQISPVHLRIEFKKQKLKRKFGSEIQEYLSDFQNNYIPYLNLIASGLQLLQFQKELRISFEKTMEEKTKPVFRSLSEVLKEYKSALISRRKQRVNKKDLDFFYEPINPPDAREFVSILRLKQKTIVSDLPQEIEVMSYESLEKLEKNEFQTVEIVSIPIKKYIESSIEIELMKEIYDDIEDISPLILSVEATINDSLEIVQSEFRKKGTNKKNLEDCLDTQILRIEKEIENLDIEQKKVEGLLFKKLENVLEKFNIFYLVRKADNLGRIVKSSERRKYFFSLQIYWNRLADFLIHYLSRIFYHENKISLLRIRQENLRKNRLESSMALHEQLIVDKRILDVLPFYYKNLFLSKNSYNKNMFYGQREEITTAGKIFEHNKSGSILIYGEPESGKSWLSYHLAENFFPEENIFEFFPPEEGVLNINQFYRFISGELDQTVNRSNFYECFRPNSVLIFHDLELFWQRREGGEKVIRELFYLIENNPGNLWFLCNLNEFTSNIFIKTMDLDTFLTGSIKSQAFSPAELQEIILSRHKSTGLQLQSSGKLLGIFPIIFFVNYFNKLYEVSGGNISAASRIFISTFTEANAETITLGFPQKPDMDFFRDLQEDWLMILLQLLLHKKLTLNRLELLMDSSEDKLPAILASLERMNLIIRSRTGIFELNPYTKQFIIKSFREMDLI
ncbi:MAG: amino acid permease [Leptospiraceae bacterium]|nr:amino acid permease [Leptospiraceae bacterium]